YYISHMKKTRKQFCFLAKNRILSGTFSAASLLFPLESSDLSPDIFYLGYYFFYKKGLLLQPP
ncbi:hypothetical protein, partial [Alteribacillus sp. HJP-4]|uniref:hypothetical protein n=1 Tax=Alteribacillus sp. HJP-4 TaxID=2775394 RepID=UPI0035CD0A80